MTQLLCDGVYLDLYDDTDLQFTHDNPLFAFDDISCERTTQFKLPATPKNDRVFSLARIPAYDGKGMRRKFDAQLQVGVVVKDGYLYVASYDGEDYCAIFVTGEFVGLQIVKDAGSVRDFLLYDNALTWSAAKDANALNLNDFDVARYSVEGATVRPSVNVKRIIEDALAQLGVQIDWTNATGYANLRVFNASKIVLSETEIHLTNDPDESQDSINLGSFLGLVQYQLSGAITYLNCSAVSDFPNWFWVSSQQNIDHFSMIKLPIDVAIEFPSDFPNSYFLVTSFQSWYYNPNEERYEEPANMPITFLGGWAFDWNGDGYGEPLAGRKIIIPANTPFCLLPSSGWVYRQATQGATAALIGYDSTRVPAYDFRVKISSDHEFVYGESTPYNAILPDGMTVVDLLQIITATSGTLLNFEDDTIKFEPLNTDTFGLSVPKFLLDRGEVSRTFGDYAQKNVLKFESGESVRGTEKLEVAYAIDNVNIEGEKDLQVLKCSEGGIYLHEFTQGGVRVVHECVKIRGTNDGSVTVARVSADDIYMLRVQLIKNTGLQALCDASTQVRVRLHMNIFEYMTISQRTKLLLEGTEYVWTSKSWQRDKAQFVLAKIL